jgi:NOL1/NOP2/sun family putative RNA methylase
VPLTEQKLQQKRQALLERTSLVLGVSLKQAEALLSIGRQQSVRINTLRNTLEEADTSMEALGVSLQSVPWAPEGRFITEGLKTIRDNTVSEEGRVYIQNAASWLPVLALDPQKDESILDMCAAPGGKTSHIAQRTDNQAFITANDNSRPRLHKLQNNLDRLGVHNVTFTLHDATRLARMLEPESYDKILLDAPCSGEGMMTLDNKKDFESWSVAHIKRLQQLQKKLIIQAWQLLKPGGTLVYSTCTMAPEENEAVVDYLLRRNPEAQIEALPTLAAALNNKTEPVLEWNSKQYDNALRNVLRLLPSPEVEAFFVAKITKPDNERL